MFCFRSVTKMKRMQLVRQHSAGFSAFNDLRSEISKQLLRRKRSICRLSSLGAQHNLPHALISQQNNCWISAKTFSADFDESLKLFEMVYIVSGHTFQSTIRRWRTLLP